MKFSLTKGIGNEYQILIRGVTKTFLLECLCSEKGVKEIEGQANMDCNHASGQCDCKDNYAGRTCDECKDNYAGESCESKYFSCGLSKKMELRTPLE